MEKKFNNVPTPGMLQGEVLILMSQLREGIDGCEVTADELIGDVLVKLTLKRQGDTCVATVECPGKEPRTLSCPLSFEDATEENDETFDIACLWSNIVNA